MPAPVFAWFGAIRPRTPEPEGIYDGEPELVPGILQRIFPDTDFAGLAPAQVYREIEAANTRLRGLDPDQLDDTGSGTGRVVAETLSMAFRTAHPLAFGRLERELGACLESIGAPDQGRALRILDVGYGPGTLSMACYALAQERGFQPSLVGVDLSPVHQQIASYLYPPSAHEVRWTVGDGTEPPDHHHDAFEIATAFDVGHHLDTQGIRRLFAGLLRCSTGHVLLSDPSDRRLARAIVGRITARDRVHRQAVASFGAAYSMQELRSACLDVLEADPDSGMRGALIDTGFMHIVHLTRPAAP